MKRFCHCIILSLFCIHGFPQTQQALYHITEENGLSDNHVHCVLKDHNGFVWIGTADGLNVMDGSQITVYKHQQGNNQSISSNEIDCLAEEANGNTWAGTGNGLNLFNSLTKKFTSYVCPASPYGNSSTIKSIAIDKQQNVWCATHGGLFLFNTVQKKFEPYFNTTQKLPGNTNRINYIMLDSRNTLWLCTFEGLWSYNIKQRSFKKEIYPGNDPMYDELFTCAMEDHNGTIWAGCYSKGLKEIDKLTGRVITHAVSSGDPHNVSCITEVLQPQGNYALWLNGTLKGYDPLAKKFFSYAGPLQAADLPDVSPCYQSADRWVWMSSDHGLFIYNPRRACFHHYLINDLTASQNISMAEQNGLLMMAAEGKDFCKQYDKDFHVVKDYGYLINSFPYKEQRASLSAISLAEENNQNLWIGTSNGIVHLNTASGESKWLLQQSPDSTMLHKNFFTTMLIDKQKNLWLFPWRGGVWQMNRATHSMFNVWDGFITEAGKKKKLVIADATEDSAGNIWMCDLDEGIILYERKTGYFSKPWQKQTGERCHSNRIFYRNGYCYSVINNIFTKWNSDRSFFKTYPFPSQMDKQVANFVPGNNGLWWMATKNGLMVFNELQQTFQRFTEADGLRSNDMDGTLFCRKDGSIVFATQGYVTTFKPDDLLPLNSSAPVAMLTGIEENGKPIDGDSVPLQFHYNASNLLFQWTIADYSDPFHNQFYCKLKGIDADWRYTGNKGEIQYANLSPGNYNLLLRGATANGITSKNILQVLFIIHAPFWKTGWFIAFCMLLTALLFYSWYRYRLQQALQLERLRAKISTDLHDDIGSTLSSISILSNMALKEKNNLLNTGMLEEIKENSLLLMEKMDDIVWSINPKNDSLENLLLRIQKFATRLLEARNIDYRIEIQDDIKTIRLPMNFRQHIYLVMKEAINNLVKYADATTTVILVSYYNNYLEVTIRDNGKGFDASLPNTGNGILNMQQRAALMNADLRIESKPALGTSILLRMKIK